MMPRARSGTGSQPRRVSSHQTVASRRQCLSADSPTGRSVGMAPQAIQPSPSRKRLIGIVSRTSASLTSTPSTCGPASSARPRSPSPQTCTPVTQSTAASAPDNTSIADSRSSGGLPRLHADQRGFVEEQHDRRVRQARVQQFLERDGPRARCRRGAAERTRLGHSRGTKCDAERQRTGDLNLDPHRCSFESARGVEERGAGPRAQTRRRHIPARVRTLP